MNEGIFTPLLTTRDWNEEWKELQRARKHADDAAAWDERAKTFPVKHGSQSGYVSDFLELAAIEPGETVLDMGCGTGALATPLAQAGHKVIACDFSEGMLNMLRADQRELGIEGVDVRQMSWADDWTRFGLAQGCVDVALASRSIVTADLKESLLKLDWAARRRVCITLPCGASPKTDARLLRAAGIERRLGHDFVYAFNILASCGIRPEVSYILNTRLELFESPDEALERFSLVASEAAKGLATPDEIAAIPDRLRPWLDENLVEDGNGFHLREPREVVWAFIAWNK